MKQQQKIHFMWTQENFKLSGLNIQRVIEIANLQNIVFAMF